MDRIQFDAGRRRTLAALAGLGASTLAGCCLPSQFGRQDIRLSRGFNDGTPHFLTPPQRTTGLGIAGGAIDAHSHFFNASDAAVTGYLVHSIGHTRSAPVQVLLRAMQPVLNALVRLAPTAAEEYDELQSLSLHFEGLTAESVQLELERRMTLRRDQVATALYREMRKQGADRVYLESSRQIAPPALRSSVPDTLTEDHIREALEPFHRPRYLPAVNQSNVAEHPDGVIKFMECMLQERWMNLKTFQAGYAGQGVDACFGALVDFDHWYRCAGRSSLQDQMKLHALISRISGSYLLPLIAYNPWTDIVTDGGALALVQEAVKHHAFIGVKIYPPVGYFPYGNDSPEYPDVMQHPDLKALDKHLRALFAWCGDNQVPVMAHTNSTMGQNDAADLMSAPRRWATLITELQREHRSPLVNLGHFGGGEDDQCWTQGFAALMAEPGGDRLYGDLGYWSELRQCDEGRATCAPVKRLLEAKRIFPELDQRLMYGSDWFMYIQVHGWDAFPGEVADALRGHFDLQRVFRDNAMTCFGLQEGGANRQRVADHLGEAPAWMQTTSRVASRGQDPA